MVTMETMETRRDVSQYIQQELAESFGFEQGKVGKLIILRPLHKIMGTVCM